MLDDGRVHKTSRRCWPHTEAIKAEVAAAETGDEQAAARAAQTIDRLLAVFLGRPVAGGWIDHVDANGAPIVDTMPASTLYHVFLAAAEADRVWGEQGTPGKPNGRSAMSSEAIRQAVILAGGKGTRLGAITETIPKPMLPIAGDRPFLDYLLEMIERHGYQDILLLGGYLGEVLEAAYDGRRIGDATIRVLRETVPLGTAGALTIARESLDPRFLMMNGDAFFDINLRALEQASHQSGAMATLALRSVPDAARYGRVDRGSGQGGRVPGKGFEPAGPGHHQWRHLCAETRDPRPRSRPALFARTGRLSGFGRARRNSGRRFDGYFLDIGLPETLEQGHRELPNVRARPAAFLDRNALVDFAERDSFRPEAFQWREGAVEAIRTLNDRGYYVLVTSGDEPRLNAAMQERLAPEGAHVDRFAPVHANR